MSSSHLSFYEEYPHVFCFIASAVILITSLFNLHSAELSEDYLPVTGEISNVEQDVKRVHRGRTRMEYDFDVSWEMDGKKHIKHFEDQVDSYREGPIDIWVSPDGEHVRFSSSEEIYRETPLWIAGGIVAGILGVVLLKRKNRKRKYMSKAERVEGLENRRIYSVLAFLCFAAIAWLFGCDIRKEYNPLDVDVVIVCVVGMLVCVAVFVHAHIKLKQ